ncbi:afadin-like [Sinocyclocheilus rhinocerous]|uniref:afadin-like n=1 Tax=Sinocyclocheilus rhinocerous TaxID=307959 RepID=UPI0007BA606F|nr:PREDICTED: afadin-like [Sinocyclocheilus rhinocerous]
MNPEERRRLQENIRQWNSNRLSLFEITEPDEDSVFHGVIRFHLQDHISGNCATKCICISSASTTQEVIETLLEKFQHDWTSQPFSYSLYEVLKNQEERKLDLSEKPLVVQLNWNKDTDGRFVLRNDSCVTLQDGCLENKEKVGVIEHFKRTLSKKEKKHKQKKNVSSSHMLENSVSGSKTNRRRLEHSRKDHEFAPKVSGQPCSEHPAFFSALSLRGGLDLEPAHRAGIHTVLELLGQNSMAATDARGGLGRKTRAGAGR